MTAVVLDVIQRVSRAVGITAPTTAVGSTDEGALQMVELLNQECRALASRHDWSFMRSEAAFTAVATTSQGTLRDCCGATFYGVKGIVNDTMWNSTRQLPIYGPTSNRRWQARKMLNVAGPYSEYRLSGELNFGDSLLVITPAPTAGDSIHFQYYTKWFVLPSTSSQERVENIESDADTLVDVCEHVGLDGWQARQVLEQGSYAKEVRAIEQYYQQRGIRSVPAIVINDRHLISGGQPPEVFEQALRHIALREQAHA